MTSRQFILIIETFVLIVVYNKVQLIQENKILFDDN